MMWIEGKFQQVYNEPSNFWIKNQTYIAEGRDYIWCEWVFIDWSPVPVSRQLRDWSHHVLLSWFWFCFCSFSEEGECKFHVLYSRQSLFVLKLFSHVLRNGLHLGSTSFFRFLLWIQLAGPVIRYYPGRMMLWTDKQLSMYITKSCSSLKYDLKQTNFCADLYMEQFCIIMTSLFNW